jgi:hypothetical protein
MDSPQNGRRETVPCQRMGFCASLHVVQLGYSNPCPRVAAVVLDLPDGGEDGLGEGPAAHTLQVEAELAGELIGAAGQDRPGAGRRDDGREGVAQQGAGARAAPPRSPPLPEGPPGPGSCRGAVARAAEAPGRGRRSRTRRRTTATGLPGARNPVSIRYRVSGSLRDRCEFDNGWRAGHNAAAVRFR